MGGVPNSQVLESSASNGALLLATGMYVGIKSTLEWVLAVGLAVVLCWGDQHDTCSGSQRTHTHTPH